MQLVLVSSLLCCMISSIYGQTYSQVAQRTFIDDAGVTHTISKANPKIICSARTALSLHHQFGLDGSQISGTYGGYFPRGSIGNIDDSDYKPYWPVDPTNDELDFLKGIANFSPSCFQSTLSKCKDIDVDMAKDTKADKWVYIDNGHWYTGEEMKEISASMGNTPIFISTHYEGDKSPGCITYNHETASYYTDLAKCTSRSLIDVIRRTNELANFLGIVKTDIALDQLRMCDAANELTTAALNAHKRGIRVMTVNPSIDDDNLVTLYPVDPLSDPFLRTYEELGVPILHSGKHPSAMISREGIPSNEWFTDCSEGSMFKRCNENAYYPVDLWLVEGRRFFFNTQDEQNFLKFYFPDKALMKNQIAHWPVNDGPISYTTAARSFTEMTRKLDEAVQLYDSTICTIADVTSEEFLNSKFGGLEGGQYACYNEPSLQLEYLQCKAEHLAYDAQMMTTDLGKEVLEPEEFTPMVSQKNVPQSTQKWQATMSIWIDKTDKKEGNSASGVFMGIIICVVVISTLVGAGVVMNLCRAKSGDVVSTAMNKEQIQAAEEGTRSSSDGEEIGVVP